MIRIAQPDNSIELAEVHVAAWQQAYSDLLPEKYLSELDAGDRSESWWKGLSEGTVTVLLDYDETALVGFAACSGSRDADAEPTWGELGALYYLRPYWGTGRAQILYEASRSLLVDRGYSKIVLWVLEGNARATAFYRKFGFDFDGKEKLERGPGFTMKELRMTAGLS